MIAIMTDHDMEEKSLLNALDDPYNHYNPHSLCYDNRQQQSHYRGSDNYNHGPDPSHYHSPYQRQYFEPRTDDRHHYRHHRHYHRHHRRVSDQNQATTVSMSTEEDFLSDIDLFEGSQSELHINPVNEHGMVFPAENAQNTIHDEMKPAHSPKVPRRITLEDDDAAAANNSNDITTPERPEQTQSPKVSPRRKSTKRRKNNRENPEPFKVGTPTKPDILCGQSRVCANHPGNRRFQAVLDDFLYRYDIATSKQEKMCMTKEVVSIIHADGGRFLKYKDGMWEEISTVAARDKVSHALRTKVASWKKQKQMMEGANDAPLGTNGRTSKFKEQRRASSRRSSTASDIASVSFDGGDPSVVSGLMKAQQEFFANLTSDPQPDDEAPTAFRTSLSDGEDNDDEQESFAPPRRSSSRF